MKKLFYIGLLALGIFEIMNIYFILPIPGSQQMESIELAYFLYSWRWVFRAIFLVIILAGSISAFSSKRKWIPFLALMVTFGVLYVTNVSMSVETRFLQPAHIVFKSKAENKIPRERLVIGVEYNGEAKAYPVEYLTYHHQVVDWIGNKKIMVTYCNVCRTGRIYVPEVNGANDTFRLVGMDHFNALFEDASTGSWWRQATGEAVTGKMKGSFLPEMLSMQMTINKWFELYPHGLVMQADTVFHMEYDPKARYEQGKRKGKLTRTDRRSWKDKSWVVGIQIGDDSKAYDWHDLKSKGIINDNIGSTPIVILLSSDSSSFVAYERPAGINFTARNDTLYSDNTAYNFSGQNLNEPLNKLKPINAYQEFWHSWATFHPGTEIFRLDEAN